MSGTEKEDGEFKKERHNKKRRRKKGKGNPGVKQAKPLR